MFSSFEGDANNEKAAARHVPWTTMREARETWKFREMYLHVRSMQHGVFVYELFHRVYVRHGACVFQGDVSVVCARKARRSRILTHALKAQVPCSF